MAHTTSTRLLTVEQANWLRISAYLPPLVLLGVLFSCIIASACLLTTFPSNPFLIGFVAAAAVITLIVAAFTLLYAYRNHMDLRDGVAQVRIARLVSKQRRKLARNAPRFYVRFEGLDEMETLPEIYESLREGEIYTVVYSPRVRRCWKADAA